jgi:TetR/AcrR family transcriptional regulator
VSDNELASKSQEAAVPADAPVRKRLLASAVELFTSRGYATTTVREIVEAAGVTKPSLYYHFQSKGGLYLAIMQETYAEFDALVDRLCSAEGTPWEKVRGLCAGVFSAMEERLPMVRLTYALYYGPPQGAPFFDFERYHRKLEGALYALLKEGVEASDLRADSLEDMTLAVMAVVNVVIETALCHPESSVGREGLERLLSLVYQGICPR